MPAPVLTLKCPNCFVPLVLRDRSLVNRRTVCPKCDELMYLAADPDRIVVGILPSRHNASALTVYGVLDFPEEAPSDPHAVASAAGPVHIERTLEEVAARTPPVQPRRPLKAIDFPIDEPVELNDVGHGAAVPGTPRTGSSTQKKRPVATPATGARKPSAAKPAAVPLPIVEENGAARPALVKNVPPQETSWRHRLRGLVDRRSRVAAWARQNLKLVLVAGVLLLLLIVQLSWMFRGSGEGTAATPPASASKGSSSVGQPSEAIPDRGENSSSRDSSAGIAGHEPDAHKTVRPKGPDPLRDVLPAPPGNDDGDDPGREGVPEAVVNRPDAPAVAEVPQESPATIIVASDKPKRDPIDVAARLRQPLASFDQARPATARSLFETLEEMIGVPVLMDVEGRGPSAAALDQKLTLKLKNTTVGDLLQAVADRTGLQWRIDGETIRMRGK